LVYQKSGIRQQQEQQYVLFQQESATKDSDVALINNDFYTVVQPS
jgi:hypothetical protein